MLSAILSGLQRSGRDLALAGDVHIILYMLMITARLEEASWRLEREPGSRESDGVKMLKASAETDHIAERLYWGDTPEGNERQWYRIEGVPQPGVAQG